MWSSSPVRTPKLQLAAEQPSTGKCWIPPKKDTPHPRAKEKPQKDSRRGEITFRIKPHTHQRHSKGSIKPCAHQDPEFPQRLSQTCTRVSRSLSQRRGLAVACCRVGGTECSSACTGPFERDHHYLHYLHHSLISGTQPHPST